MGSVAGWNGSRYMKGVVLADIERWGSGNRRTEGDMAEKFDMRDHDETWSRFTKMTVYGTVAVVVLLVLLAIFLL